MKTSLLISGIVPPVPTPFDHNGRIDEPALRKILNHLVDGGCHGVFVLGSSGELASIDGPSREAVIRVTVDEIDGRIPVLTGINATCPAAGIALARVARDLGPDAEPLRVHLERLLHDDNEYVVEACRITLDQLQPDEAFRITSERIRRILEERETKMESRLDER